MVQVANIFQNPYFGVEFATVYICCLLILLTALILANVFIFSKDKPETRQLVPWIFILAAISSLAIILWICIYLVDIYKEPYIKVPLD